MGRGRCVDRFAWVVDGLQIGDVGWIVLVLVLVLVNVSVSVSVVVCRGRDCRAVGSSSMDGMQALSKSI
jgi:hypothetical protein